MNKIYRLIWNEITCTWMTVSEIARGRGKRASGVVGGVERMSAALSAAWKLHTAQGATLFRPTLLALAIASIGTAYADPAPTQLPTGGQLVAGSASIAQSGAVMNINQTSQRGAINWQTFNVGSAATVNFNQPSSSSVTLNRVLDSNPSQIYGHLIANGQVFFTNPNGMYFAPSASVDVGGLVATTHSISNADFMAGNNVFNRNGATGSIINDGKLSAALGGYIALLAPEVRNNGVIVAQMGTVALAAGETYTLQFDGNNTLANIVVTPATIKALVENGNAVQAPGGLIILSAQAADQLQGGVINNSGSLAATGLVSHGGVITLKAGYVAQSGSLDVSGSTGGAIAVNARAIMDSGTARANGSTGNGGSIQYNATDAIVQTASASMQANSTNATGGDIHLQGNNSLFSSATLSALGAQGGSIETLGNSVTLAAASLDVSGSASGGTIRVGGDFHGANPALLNAQNTQVNRASTLKAAGGSGKVVLWSDVQTDFSGNINAGNAGNIEISSKGTVNYSGIATAGLGGTLLLDPTNIVISAPVAGGIAYTELLDPHSAAGNGFGDTVTALGTTSNGVFTASGMMVVSAPGDSLMAGGSGAVYLFNRSTGALVSTLTGSQAGDAVGSDGITALRNGNYVVASSNWTTDNNGNSLGAVTWGNGTTGISGTVSASNSLVGSTAGDFVGIDGITALSNGNYVVRSSSWNNRKGAVTWGNGTTGATIGAVSASNSLVGSTANDIVGYTISTNGQDGGITALSNGNYVVASSSWNNSKGAVTWGNGTTGATIGAVSASNSLVGSKTGDSVGNGGVTILSNGNYVVGSPSWTTDGNGNSLGAVTWGDGTKGVSGTVSASNSLVGSKTGDQVGFNGVTALSSNGNYVVVSPSWTTDKNGYSLGAVTWGDGTKGISGTVSASNSLVGSKTGDFVGNGGVTALSNGNYVVSSYSWTTNIWGSLGAATWANGTTGISGTISAGNSLVGSGSNDQVSSSGITALSNGNYVVSSSYWQNGTVASAGAATWGNGTTGIKGTISSSNSLVGSGLMDSVGGGVIALSNGNYVVQSPNWTSGGGSSGSSLGAVTWGDGTTGSSGTVSASNSLVGSTPGDGVGYYGITALSNGNYVVQSPFWINGSAAFAGAVTWGDGTKGSSGTVSASNSLVGSTANDRVGETITALSNGNYVVASPNWANGTATYAGAVTWGNGTTGSSGTVSASNSLVGSTTYDAVGYAGITVLSNGNYVVPSPNWNNGAGAATWGSGTTGISGTISAGNSLVGSTAGDGVGYRITDLGNGAFTVNSPNFSENSGQVMVSNGALSAPVPGFQGNVNFADSTGSAVTSDSSWIGATLAAGTAVTLQASNDITVNSAITATGSTGGALTLQAGRNINLNANITTANGNLTAIAGDSRAVSADLLAGTPAITLASGVTVNAGTGRVIFAAKGGNFVNNSGSATPITAAQYWIYSSSPAADTLGSMAVSNKHYNQAYTSTTPAYAATGNWNLYSIAPVLSVTPGSQAVTYGTAPASFTAASYSGFIDGDSAVTAGISGTATFNVGGATSTSGNYTAAAHDVAYNSGLASSLGYTFADNTGSVNELTVNQLTVSANSSNVSKVYDASRSMSGVALGVSGKIANDLVSVAGAGTFSAKDAGTNLSYSVDSLVLSGADASNYTLSATSLSGNNGIITPATVTLSASKTYNGNTSLTGGVTIGTGVGDETLTYTGATANDANVATGNKYINSITLANATDGSGGLASNYQLPTLNSSNAPVTINPANLTVTASNASKTYGQTPTLTAFSSSGLQNDETIGSVTQTSAGTAATANVASSPYSVTPSAATGGTFSASNYNITYANGSLTITPAPLTVTANDANKVSDGVIYGGGNGVVYAGFVNNETNAVLGGTLSYSGSSQGASSAGSYTITPQGLTSSNYQIAVVEGTLTITAPPVTVLPPSPPPVEQPVAPTAPPDLTLPAGPAAASVPAVVSIVRQATLLQAGIVKVSVPLATIGSSFNFSLPAQLTSGAGGKAVINVTGVNGQPLPSWLQFNQATNAFDATDIPDGALPLQLVVTVGGKRSTIMISQ